MTSSNIADQSDSSPTRSPGSAEVRRTRLRFSGFSFKRSPAAYCTAEVELEWVDGARFTGHAEGVATPYNDLRLSAEATLRAITAFAHGDISFELLGVKTLRAFDANVVIVAVNARRAGGDQRVMGCQLADDDALRGAVLATLQATNRIVGALTEV